MGTAFPLLVFQNALLTALRTIFRPKCNRLYDFALYTVNCVLGEIPPPRNPQKRPRCLDPYTNFCLVPQRSRCSCSTKRPLVGVHCLLCVCVCVCVAGALERFKKVVRFKVDALKASRELTWVVHSRADIGI